MIRKFMFDDLRVIVNQYERLTAKKTGLQDEDPLRQFLTPAKNESISDLARLVALYRASDPDKGERDAVWDRLQRAHQGMKKWASALETSGVVEELAGNRVARATAIDICSNSIQSIEKILSAETAEISDRRMAAPPSLASDEGGANAMSEAKIPATGAIISPPVVHEKASISESKQAPSTQDAPKSREPETAPPRRKRFVFDELRVLVNQYERLTAKRVGLNDEDVLCQFLTPRHNEAMADLARLTALYRASDPSKDELDVACDRLRKAHHGLREWGRALEAARIEDGPPTIKVTAAAIDICANSIQAIEKILGWTDAVARTTGAPLDPKAIPEPKPTELRVTLNQFQGVSPQIAALASALRELPGGDSRPLPELGVSEQFNATRWFADLSRIIQAANVRIDAAKKAAKHPQKEEVELRRLLEAARKETNQLSQALRARDWLDDLEKRLGPRSPDSPPLRERIEAALKVQAAAESLAVALRAPAALSDGRVLDEAADGPTTRLLQAVAESMAAGQAAAGPDVRRAAWEIDAECSALRELARGQLAGDLACLPAGGDDLAKALMRLEEAGMGLARAAKVARTVLDCPNPEAFADADESDWLQLAEVMSARRRMRRPMSDSKEVGSPLKPAGEARRVELELDQSLPPGVME